MPSLLLPLVPGGKAGVPPSVSYKDRQLKLIENNCSPGRGHIIQLIRDAPRDYLNLMSQATVSFI